MKICKVCKQEKSLDNYYISRGYHLNTCKECLSIEYKNKYRSKHPDCLPIDKNIDFMKCTNCLIEKDISMFGFRKEGSIGLHRQCKECRKNKAKEYRDKNKEELKKKNREYTREKRRDVKEREKEKERCRIYRIKNKEKRKDFFKSDRYKKYKREYERRRELENPSVVIRKRLRKRFNEAINNKKKYVSVLKLLGCSIEDLKQYLESKFQEGMSWENYGKRSKDRNWHIDHIVPCCSFDLTKLEEQQKCFHYTNLQPLWEEDNLKKGSKLNWTNHD